LERFTWLAIIPTPWSYRSRAGLSPVIHAYSRIVKANANANVITSAPEGGKMNRFLLAVALLLCLLTPAFGQFEAGSVLGTVRDANGGVVTGAKITLTNTATGITATATTDSNGNYEFPTVTIGVYTISAEQPGFSRAVANNVAVKSALVNAWICNWQ
jgi:Carboxypeptidase regulatory-like domain